MQMIAVPECEITGADRGRDEVEGERHYHGT